MSTFPLHDPAPEPCPQEVPEEGAPALEAVTALTTPVIGRIVGLKGGRFLVTFDGSTSQSIEARTVVALSAQARCQAAEQQAEVLLVFEGGSPESPIIIGLLQPDVAMLDLVLQDGDADADPTSMVDLRVDGETQRIQAQEELVLQCGEASITLRDNGKIVLRGTYIESHAQGTNRIKGGAVRIN